MNSKLRISIVSYLNSKPFLFGLEQEKYKKHFSLDLDIPSVCADKLMHNQVDIGLVPVAIIPELEHFQLVSDYCIGSEGEVSSVLLLSEVPLDKIQTVMLDYQSRTSVQLAQLLATQYWHISPEWRRAEPGYETYIHESTAAVVIGDRALLLRNNFSYVYDLSMEWNKWTGLPFVFACWVANKDIPQETQLLFNEALSSGLQSIPDVIEKYGSGPVSEAMAKDYLEKKIQFRLDENKRKALKLFLEKVKQTGSAMAR